MGELQVLGGWARHFDAKYPVVGQLKEYANWSFKSALESTAAATDEGPSALDLAKQSGGSGELEPTLQQLTHAQTSVKPTIAAAKREDKPAAANMSGSVAHL